MKTLTIQQSSKLNINAKIIQACQSQCQKIKQRGYKNSKTFFVSQAYHFILELIHLHSQQINHFIRIVLKDYMHKKSKNHFEQISQIDLFKDMNEYSKQKNLVKETIQAYLQKMIKYFLYKECEGKNLLQIQNVELEIQCSLNYTCPNCLKQKGNDKEKSLKIISSQTENITESANQEKFQTQKLINGSEITQNISIQFCKKQITRQSVLNIQKNEQIRQIELKQKHTKCVKNIWNALGDIMFLEKDKFINDKKHESNDKKSQSLYNQLYAKNTHNQKMIKHFYKKNHKKQQSFQSRSLSIRSKQNENFNNQSQSIQQAKNQKKYTSLRYIEKQIQINHAKSKIVESKKSILSPISNFNRNTLLDQLIKKSNSFIKNSALDLYSSINSSVDDNIKQESLKKKKTIIKQKQMELPSRSIVRSSRKVFQRKHELPNIFQDKVLRLNSTVQVE